MISIRDSSSDGCFTTWPFLQVGACLACMCCTYLVGAEFFLSGLAKGESEI